MISKERVYLCAVNIDIFIAQPPFIARLGGLTIGDTP